MAIQQLNWFRVALQLRGSVASTIYPRVLLAAGFGFLVSLLYYQGFPVSWKIWGSLTTNVVFNLVLGLLLVFRTNTAYDRFWEGRKSWGEIVVNVRNLARQIWVGVAELEAGDKDNKVAILRLLAAFAIATKLHLRQQEMNTELKDLVTPDQFIKLKSTKNPPLQLALWIGDYLHQQEQRNCITSNQLYAMNTLLDSMVNALTGCERIVKTPIPIAYAIYLKRLLIIYCVTLPLQVVNELHWWTGIMVFLMSFVLLGIEEIGNEIENPFGNDFNDIPLDDICQMLLDNINQVATT